MAIGYKVVKGSATKARARRHFRLRKRVVGTQERPRLVVSRSARHLFVQIVDDSKSATFAGDKTAKAKQVGELIAKRAKEKGISAVVFDRGGNKFHGRVAAVATSARANGLEF